MDTKKGKHHIYTDHDDVPEKFIEHVYSPFFTEHGWIGLGDFAVYERPGGGCFVNLKGTRRSVNWADEPREGYWLAWRGIERPEANGAAKVAAALPQGIKAPKGSVFLVASPFPDPDPFTKMKNGVRQRLEDAIPRLEVKGKVMAGIVVLPKREGDMRRVLAQLPDYAHLPVYVNAGCSWWDLWVLEGKPEVIG